MKFFSFIFCVLFLFSAFVHAQNTYKVGDTEYYYNQYYSTTGKPKVKRSSANKKQFLNNMGYTSVPYGYEIDHIVPLSQGGSDSPYNMQLLTVEQHKAKTARERSSTSSTAYPRSYYNNSTQSYSVPSYYYQPSNSISTSSTYSLPSSNTYSSSSSSRTYCTGSRGGTYYINSNGNKTYVKK